MLSATEGETSHTLSDKEAPPLDSPIINGLHKSVKNWSRESGCPSFSCNILFTELQYGLPGCICDGHDSSPPNLLVHLKSHPVDHPKDFVPCS